jgi:betaine lipid synthase
MQSLILQIDRVNLDGARRDYLEYRFGTKVSINARNHMFGVQIPYYIWIGCSKSSPSMEQQLAELDAAATESPFLAALDVQAKASLKRNESFERKSKAYECAVVNLTGKLPLPCFWYQNHHWRIYYDHRLKKHTQFNDQYIYAFTWEDSRVDARILKINSEDVILALTSAGDNILSFAAERPKRIHAVDLKCVSKHAKIVLTAVAPLKTTSWSSKSRPTAACRTLNSGSSSARACTRTSASCSCPS